MTMAATTSTTAIINPVRITRFACEGSVLRAFPTKACSTPSAARPAIGWIQPCIKPRLQPEAASQTTMPRATWMSTDTTVNR